MTQDRSPSGGRLVELRSRAVVELARQLPRQATRSDLAAIALSRGFQREAFWGGFHEAVERGLLAEDPAGLIRTGRNA